jgi:hypothetical protein
VSRYRIFPIVFVVASLLATGWLLLDCVEYRTVGFDCDIPNLYGMACVEAARKQIAHDIWIEGLAIFALWCIGLWLLIRERKKR